MALREMAHDRKCRCGQCSKAIYAQQLQLVQAIGNQVPKDLSDALDRQWGRYDEVGFLPLSRAPNLVLHELEQAPQQKPLARLK